MLIEIHMIQNHSPANLNRDDLGAPKTCLFGGATRARISSQCLKRSIRRSEEFQRAMAGGGARRTRNLIREIAARAHGAGDPPPQLVERIRKVFEDGGVGVGKSGGEENVTDILFFVPDAAIDNMAAAASNPKSDLPAAFARVLAETAHTPDIALAGRMTEFRAKDHFEKLDLSVEASLSVAHAISTHEVVNEVDYFTAADDLAAGAGAGHVNEAMFASACFYKHFCIDWDQLVANLGGDADLAAATARHFLVAAAITTPSGKQTSFAAFNPPEGILVEVKSRRVPVSYANAFADPVPSKSERGLIGESIARLGQHVRDMSVGYGIEAERFWFSPNGRRPLSWIDRAARRGGEEKPVIEDASRNIGALDELVGKFMRAVQSGARPAAGAAL